MAQSYERKGKKLKELTESVAFFLARDGQPMYTVEKSHFRQLLKTFDAKYQFPSRKYFSRLLFLVCTPHKGKNNGRTVQRGVLFWNYGHLV